MSQLSGCVHIVGGPPAAHEGVVATLGAAGFRTHSHPTIDALIGRLDAVEDDCAVPALRGPDSGGRALVHRLDGRRAEAPLVFVADQTIPFDDAVNYARVARTLTPRQRDVLAGIIDGLSNKMIAYRLGLSVRTVEAHRAALLSRTRCKTIGQLVRLAVHAGL